MQWTITCILLASTALISALDHGDRSKRDLSFLKSHILSKIFGSCKLTNDSTPVPPQQENYRLFKIPGHDNILVKAVPKVKAVLETDGPPSILEVIESKPEPVHPSISIVSKYLGTEKLNDTLLALQGVKNLLQSGVLTAKREGLDKTTVFNNFSPSVVVESSEIVLDGNRRLNKVYPSYGETVIGSYNPYKVFRYPNLPVPSTYSYKQVNNAGMMLYTANDNQNVFVTETKRPVPLPQPISYRIQDILLMGTYHLPTSPAMHMTLEKHPSAIFTVPKVQVPHQSVEVKPSYASSGYSYKQVHNDGSTTTYSGSGHVEEHGGQTAVVTEARKPMSVFVAEVEGPAPFPVFNVPKVQIPLKPLNVPSHGSGYSYNHLHSDGFVPTFSGAGHIERGEDKPAVVITDYGQPTVVVADVDGPPAPFPVATLHNVKETTGSGYTYNHVHKDGTVTTYTGSGHVLEHGVDTPNVVVSDVQRPTAPFPVFDVTKMTVHSTPGNFYNYLPNNVENNSAILNAMAHEEEKTAMVITENRRPNKEKVKAPSSSGYSYNHVHNDGTVTSYSGSGHVVEQGVKRPAAVITEYGKPTVVVSDIEGPPAPIPVFNVPQVPQVSGHGYAYSHVHNDGTITAYPGSGHVLEEEKTAMVITEPGRPTIVVPDIQGPPAPFYVVNDVKVKVPSSSGYSYNHVHNDGSVTRYTGSGHVLEQGVKRPAAVITEYGTPTVVVSDKEGPPAPIPVFNVPRVPQFSGHGNSYSHVQNDSSITDYTGPEHVLEEEKTAMVITEPGRPTIVVPDIQGPPAPFPVNNLEKVKVPSNSGYSYNHVHKDGSVTSYSGSGHVLEHGVERPTAVLTEYGQPTVFSSGIDGPPAPIPVFNAPRVPEVSGHEYAYSHVYKDGSITTYPGTGHVQQNQEDRTAMVITESERPTAVPDVKGPPAPFQSFDATKMTVSSAPGYSYNHVHNGGAVTTFTGTGNVLQSEGEKTAMVIIEPGRPTIVVPDDQGPAEPFPVFDATKLTIPGHGYSYNHVHNDGSITSYAGSGQVEEHQGAVVVTETRQPMPLPTFLTNRIKNAAAAASATGFPAGYYGPPKQVVHEQTVIVEERPNIVTNAGQNLYREAHRQNIGGQTKVQSVSQNSQHDEQTFNIASGFSYQTVHQDGTVTSYNDGLGVQGALVVNDRPLLYPTGPSEFHEERIQDKVKCKDPAHTHQIIKENDEVKANSNSSKFSYTMVSGGASSTTYSDSGHVEHSQTDNVAVQGAMVNQPVLVTQTDNDNPQMVRIKPVISQYMYKQINHHRPNEEITIVNVGHGPAILDGQVNVQVSASDVNSMSELQAVEVAEIPKDYVFIPPDMYEEESVPTRKPVVADSTTEKVSEKMSGSSKTSVVVSTRTKTSFSPKRRHRVRTTTSVPVKTSAPLTTTPDVPSSTMETSSELSLSANPIVVLPEENVFSFKQDRPDGSSITVVGNNDNKVSVVEEQKTSLHRGDIPDSSY